MFRGRPMTSGRSKPDLAILQVGCGGFGPTHLAAWSALGLAPALWVADPDPAARARAAAAGVAAERIVADHRAALDRVEVVDVVAPTDRHVEICLDALAAGRDLFCEKPLALDLAGAEAVAEAAARGGRVVQVGYYFRHHPLARYAKARLGEGALGPVRHLAASFVGFKRARRDSGATGNDAIHFLDLATWLVGAAPVEVFAVQRDHFGRGFDDLVIALLTYPGEVIARIEAGYVQPGRWVDDVVPEAQATKELTISGTEGALEIDFRIGRLVWHRVRHERHADGLWRPVFRDAIMPQLATPGPVAIVASQLGEFLGHVAARTRPAADVQGAGVELARLYEAIGRSARAGRPVSIPASAGA